MPGTGLMTLGAAALFGISTVLRTETSDKAFRVNEVLRQTPFTSPHRQPRAVHGDPVRGHIHQRTLPAQCP
jgi:hypothetical protein